MRGKKTILWNVCGICILGSNVLLICLKSLLNYDIRLHIGRCHQLCIYHSSIPFENQQKYISVMWSINITDTAWENKITHLNIQTRCFEMQLLAHIACWYVHASFYPAFPTNRTLPYVKWYKKGLWYCLGIVPCKNTLPYYHMDEDTYYSMLQIIPWLTCICGWSGWISS